MIKLDIKPFSVNEAWQGKRYRTTKYKKWRGSCSWLLPNRLEGFDKDKHYKLSVKFGVSGKRSDIDNPLKPFLDALTDRYRDFDDRLIYELNVLKHIVPKGQEYITFEIEEINYKTF